MKGAGETGGMPKRLLKRAGLSLLSLALALLAAEWCLGRFFPIGSVIYQLDPELLHTTLPGARSSGKPDRSCSSGRGGTS